MGKKTNNNEKNDVTTLLKIHKNHNESYHGYFN